MTIDSVRGAPDTTELAEPELVQLLTPEGERVEHPDYPLDLSAEEVRDLYRDLVIVRRIDLEAVALTRQGELGIWASLLGQEAAQIGSGRALSEHDMVFPTYREHGVAWCRGVEPLKLLGLFRGVSHGGWDPGEHGFHLYTIVIGSQTLHATGYAMGVQRDGVLGTPSAGATIAYFGDGATSQGDVNESFVFASVFNAPIVFFCQNNQFAISVPLQRQTASETIAQKAVAYGFPGVRVDGNDVLAVYKVTKEALDRARAGEGPTLIEAVTYRFGPHTTADDPTRYRSEEEAREWVQRRDPLKRYRALLRAEGLLTEAEEREWEEECRRRIDRAVKEAEAEEAAPPTHMFDHVFGTPVESLKRQRSEWEVGGHAGTDNGSSHQ